MNPRGIVRRTDCPWNRSSILALSVLNLSLLMSPSRALAQTLSSAFGAYQAFPVASWPEAVAIGDLNSDGRNDVVLGTSTYGSSANNQCILIFYQTGNGGLAAPVRYSADGNANSIVIADFTADGKNDIAVGRGSAGIRVFMQGPGGGFDSFTTREANEPEHEPGAGGASVWWTWQPAVSGTVTLSTVGSSFDTVLAAYIGSPAAGLTLVASNDDWGANITSQISFFAAAGTVYQIAVDGFGAAVGTIHLTLLQ